MEDGYCEHYNSDKLNIEISSPKLKLLQFPTIWWYNNHSLKLLMLCKFDTVDDNNLD